MRFTTQSSEKFTNARTVFLPKGENRRITETTLMVNGFDVPEFDGRCLHLPCFQ